MIEYEWDIQTRVFYNDESGLNYEIERHDYADCLGQYSSLDWSELDGTNFTLVLIRRNWDYDMMNFDYEEAESHKNKDGIWILPKMFADFSGIETRNIPKRFHGELAKRQCQAKVPTN